MTSNLNPSFPGQYRVVPPKKKLQTNDATILSWDMIGDGNGLAGSQIGIEGLEQTTTDALVRIRLADGSVHRVVLRPTETSTTIPHPDQAKDLPKELHISFLQFIDHWRYGLLFSNLSPNILASFRLQVNKKKENIFRLGGVGGGFGIINVH